MFDSPNKLLRKEMEQQEEMQESSDETVMRDAQTNVQNLPSNIMPQDFYEYKRFVNLPETQAKFSQKIDKDVVFANFGGAKPTIEELRFQVGTIELFEGEFVEEIRIPRRDQAGNLIKDSKGNTIIDTFIRFDEAFRSCLDFLQAEYKFAVVASRALGGNDRAAFLDISSNQRIQKEFSKKKDADNKLFGTGGM